MHFKIYIYYHKETFTPILPKGKLTNYPIIVLLGKNYPTIILRLSIEIWDCIITLTQFLSNENLSLIMSTWRICYENLKSCLCLVVGKIFFLSLYLCAIVSVCYVYLYLFMIKGDYNPVWSRVTILIYCNLSNTHSNFVGDDVDSGTAINTVIDA